MTTPDQELVWQPAVELARLVRAREVSPVELAEVYLARIERLDPQLGSHVTVVADQALAAAKDAESRLGEPDVGPFHGVPISIKDLHATEGIVTTGGFAAMRNHVPNADDANVRRIREAGFILLGKTTAPAFGLGCVSEPSGYPPARNPWDPERTPGGSSGGTGAAVAAALNPVGHGSDGGGSIRIPSAWCGLVGIKPSRGRISSSPEPSSFTSTTGPMARTVEDAAALLDVMSGSEPGDAYWAPAPERPFRHEVRFEPGRLRIALATDGRELDPPVRAGLESTAAILASLGHEVIEAEPVARWSRIVSDGVPEMGVPGIAGVIASLPTTEGLDPIIAGFAKLTATISVEGHMARHGALLQRARQAAAAFVDYDVLLSPAAARMPPRVGEHRDLPLLDLFTLWETYVPFTGIWNWTGQPAISVPAEPDPTGLPVGMQLVGRPFDEATLLRLAAQLEQAQPWSGRRPPVS